MQILQEKHIIIIKVREVFWRIDPTEYRRAHYLVQSRRGKANSCINRCKHTDYQWANLTGHYFDRFDYVSMCVPCHTRFDHLRVAVIRIPNK